MGTLHIVRRGSRPGQRLRLRWRASSALGLLVACGALADCSRTAGEAPAPAPIRLTTGVPGGAFHPLGAELHAAYSRLLPDRRFEVLQSGGALDNLQALQDGSADLGLAFTDVSYMAFIGKGIEHHGAFEQLRGMAVLQLTPVHVIVGPDSRLTSLQDFRGTRISLGPTGSGTAATAEVLLAAFGLSREDVGGVYMPFNDGARAVVRGSLDATFISAGFPAESVSWATAAGARLLELGGPAVDRLRLEYPFLKVVRIPAGTYPGHARDIHTVGVDALLVCRVTLDETLVYRLTKALFDALPDLADRLGLLRSMDPNRAPATPIPLHVGAARYYRERELSR
jgi:TRAP transporter TAXI family solute receptor